MTARKKATVRARDLSGTSPRRKKKATEAPARPPRRKVLLVDDHPMMLSGLAQLIDTQPDLYVCGQACSPVEALREIPRCMPDVLLTDLAMPGRSGLEFIKDVHALAPELPILILSMHDESIYAERVLRAGARGYVMKSMGGKSLLNAIRRVLQGNVAVSESMAARLIDAATERHPRNSTSPIQTLSDREFEVFQLIGQGMPTREISGSLGISSKTVDVHRSHIKEKLGLKDAISLVRYAVRWVETNQQAAGDQPALTG